MHYELLKLTFFIVKLELEILPRDYSHVLVIEGEKGVWLVELWLCFLCWLFRTGLDLEVLLTQQVNDQKLMTDRSKSLKHSMLIK